MMSGPDPHGFGTLALAIVVGAGGALVAVSTLMGWAALELMCLLEQVREA
ncbi:hypothetical protein [Aureimonas sp. AU4]|nr:hypothetical protein [Aureimonas sp. AU4]